MFGCAGLNLQGRLFCRCNNPYPRYCTIPSVYPLASFPWIKWLERNINNIRSQINNSSAFMLGVWLLSLAARAISWRHASG
ncbi:hypothetical protein DFO62_10573 [Serratia fonticola]|nr:hypothetical protein DFO62_10573 [Serratia fonticola]